MTQEEFEVFVESVDQHGGILKLLLVDGSVGFPDELLDVAEATESNIRWLEEDYHAMLEEYGFGE